MVFRTTASDTLTQSRAHVVWSDESLNVQDKTLQIVEGRAGLAIECVRVELVTATGATPREITLEVLDEDDDVIGLVHADAASDVGASTSEVIEFYPNLPIMYLAPIDGGPHQCWMPEITLDRSNKLRIHERNTVNAADDMTVHVRGRMV